MGNIIKIKVSGDFKKTNKFFDNLLKPVKMSTLDKYGKMGVKLLADNTPKDSGKTAASWDYVISREEGKTSIIWVNNNINKNQNIAIILQYGHATRNGGYVEGKDYINPALQPLFDKMSKDLWEEVINE